MDKRTTPSEATREEEQREAVKSHEPDRPPTDEEEEEAEQALADSESSGDRAEVRRNYQDMAERGVQQKGEGKIE
jgi:hypothetical protein